MNQAIIRERKKWIKDASPKLEENILNLDERIRDKVRQTCSNITDAVPFVDIEVNLIIILLELDYLY